MPAEPLALGTGDFEAVSYQEIPRAPRAPVFHRSMAPQAMPESYGFGNGGHYPAHYAQTPQAPHSLSPVAMSSARDAVATGPQRAQPTVVIRSRPTARMGVMILLAGALLGAVFGIGMRVRDNAAEAAFAAQQDAAEADREAAQAAATPPPAPAPLAPVVIGSNTGVVAPKEPAPPSAAPAQDYSGVPFGSLVVTPPAQKAAAPAAAAPAAKAAPHKHASWGRPAGGHPSLSAKVSAPAKEKDDGYKVASAGNDEPREAAPSKASSKREAREPAEPKEAKRAETKPAKPARSSDEADKVLRAAMGATENTL
ncbi:MAG: hypothetical protein KF795_22595 [Labilithrix sp.]|nr:hypothetical protein [Labilithrix sp.]